MIKRTMDCVDLLSRHCLAVLLSLFPLAVQAAMADSDNWRQASEQRIYRYSLSELGHDHSVALQGSQSSALLSFGSRLDEIVEAAELELHYSVSPALQARESHLKVYLNDELMGIVDIGDGERQQQSIRIALQTRYLADFNQLRIELIGELPDPCFSPDSFSIWTEIGAQTSLQLRSRVLPVANNLQLLPAPFFDRRDYRPLQLPIVMSGEHSLQRLRAAGIAASWFGSLAAWRGASFPLSDGRLPPQHALVFMTNSQRPEALKDFPQVEAATVQIIGHPQSPGAKLLLIQGRDDADLLRAVKGLALGSDLLSGAVAEISDAVQSMPRKPYDAPNWLPTDRPVRLGELVDSPMQLQVKGRTPSPVKVAFQLPPDLFTWRSRGIPVKLDYRYSPPVEDGSGSQMSLSINNQFVEAFNLTRKGFSGEAKRLRVPLLNDGFLSSSQQLRIPAFKVGSRNELQFQFDFAGITSGACKSVSPGRRYAAVDASSTLDFSGFAHYIEMPNLRAFANAGFPFTRMADLSETAVLLPDSQHPQILQTYLQIMGFVGASAGYPALGVELYNQWSAERLRNRDILLIAASGDIEAGKDLPLLFDESRRVLKTPRANLDAMSDSWGGADLRKSTVAASVDIRAQGRFAALLGMRSPYSNDRSVVAMLAAQPKDMVLLRDALADAGKVAGMYGSVVTLRDGSQASFNVGDKYYVGKLAVWDLIWYHFSRYPVLLGAISVLVALMLAIVLWRLLSGVARRRLRRGGE